MTAKKQVMADMMRGLRLHYIEQLQARVDVLKPLQARDAWTDEERATVRMHAHQLSGTGTTYGFQPISEAGRMLEEALVDHPTEAAAFFLPKLQALLDSCHAAMIAPAEPVAKENEGKKAPLAPRNSHMPYVLLVDDDPAVETMLRALLSEVAMLVTVGDASQAIEAIAHYAPDLVLLDHEMPGEIKGLGLLEKLRAMPEYATLPVMMLTSSNAPETVMRALMAGASDYIVKPFDPAQVTEKVKGRLARLNSLVLIADDDEAVRALLSHKFQAAGCKVVLAADGAKAWEIMQEKTIALAVLDRMMPGFEGMTLLTMMREVPALEQVPVVFLTARHYGSDVMEGFNTGASDYITKPFNPDEVVTRCLRLLKTPPKVPA